MLVWRQWERFLRAEWNINIPSLQWLRILVYEDCRYVLVQSVVPISQNFMSEPVKHHCCLLLHKFLIINGWVSWTSCSWQTAIPAESLPVRSDTPRRRLVALLAQFRLLQSFSNSAMSLETHSWWQFIVTLKRFQHQTLGSICVSG